MYSIKAAFDKILPIIKETLGTQCPETGNFLRPGLKPRFTDIEVIALSITAECLSIDSENRLFTILHTEYKNDFPNLLSRRQYNDRRKSLFNYQTVVRQAMADRLNDITEVYAIDSMPLEICKLARMERSKIGKEMEYTAPDKGYCRAQNKWYYGYKMHCVCAPNGVIQLMDIGKASIHDIYFLKDVGNALSNCIVVGDKGYINQSIKDNLWSTRKICLETPLRNNQKNAIAAPYVLKRIRKRIETIFSQLCDQFMMQRNYAKSFFGYRSRILAKVSGMTALQYINRFVTGKPVGCLKYALCYK
ncbi:MAG: family transposase [Flavipsychrobacter sp.]|nr:family transposase [Flavipsychrobacter sp.]